MREYRLPAPVRVLVGSQFGLFLAGNGISLIGSWMQRIACSWLVWDWTGSAFWLGILAAGDLLPVVVIGPFAGVAADRWDRLRQNRAAQFASALLAIVMAVLLAAEKLGLGMLVTLVTLQGTLVAAIQPARLAMVHQMVPRSHMGTAVALNSVNVNLARLIGPAAAGLMILRFDIVWVFIVNAIVTLVFVAILGRLRLSPRNADAPAGGFWSQLRQGFGHVRRTAVLWQILLALLLGGALVRSMLELVPAVAAESFGNTALGLAVLTGAAAAGAVTAGLTAGHVRITKLPLTVLLWWEAGAMAAMVLTWSSSPLLAASAAIVMGGAITRGLVGTQIFVQLTTPDALRGRTLSIHGLIARGSPALGALGLGYAADRVGLPITVFCSSLALMAILILLVPAIRRSAVGAIEATDH